MGDTVVMTLTDFLLARIAEDEAVARTSPPSWAAEPYSRRFDSFESDHDDADREFVDRFDPARIVAECEAKRRIVELYDQLGSGSVAQPMATALGVACKSLATIYADHPGYRAEWRH